MVIGQGQVRRLVISPSTTSITARRDAFVYNYLDEYHCSATARFSALSWTCRRSLSKSGWEGGCKLSVTVYFPPGITLSRS
jgi:hypothetical protein